VPAADDGFNADDAAATHQAVFGFNVFAYQCIFLDPSGLLGGDESDRVRRTYARAGFGVDETSDSPDHLGHELSLLAHLCGAEADAWGDGKTGVATRAQGLQAAFLDEHLLWWLPVVAETVTRQEEPFYAAVAGLIKALVVDHRLSLYQDHFELLSQAKALHATPQLPEPPDILADPKTGLKEIAGFLLTPVYGGIYLSRDDIGRMAGAVHLPRGFGERRQMLANLLRAGAEYDQMAKIVAALGALVDTFAVAYTDYGLHGARFGTIAQHWLQRLDYTRRLLAALSSAAVAERPLSMHESS
ncbi:MAG: molecular chaperone TorD family protein, partial [Caldilineaceae bacterium]|nr:molecular chaperone TorD family protein [Caldilineaceae bacterium]